MKPLQTAERNLIDLFWHLNFKHFGGILPPIDMCFSGRLKSTGGQYFRKPKKMIQISTRYFEMEKAWVEIEDTLGHELVHYWLDFRGLPCGHNRDFHAKLNTCGFNRYSRLTPTMTRYIYLCPNCEAEYYRRRQGVWSCGPCSGRRFDARFKLVLVAKRPLGTDEPVPMGPE